MLAGCRLPVAAPWDRYAASRGVDIAPGDAARAGCDMAAVPARVRRVVQACPSYG